MLPTLSCFSVSCSPEGRLRRWCSSRYLRISPLHREFHPPLLHSSQIVSKALPQLSCGLSPLTYPTTYTPFTPNNSEQRSPPLSYRGCWHRVSRGFFSWYRQSPLRGTSFQSKEVYNPKAFFPHAALLRQAFAHCAKFLTAASRRSLARVSVPVWPAILSDRLPIIALVGHYPANKLMGHEPILKRLPLAGIL